MKKNTKSKLNDRLIRLKTIIALTAGVLAFGMQHSSAQNCSCQFARYEGSDTYTNAGTNFTSSLTGPTLGSTTPSESTVTYTPALSILQHNPTSPSIGFTATIDAHSKTFSRWVADGSSGKGSCTVGNTAKWVWSGPQGSDPGASGTLVLTGHGSVDVQCTDVISVTTDIAGCNGGGNASGSASTTASSCNSSPTSISPGVNNVHASASNNGSSSASAGVNVGDNAFGVTASQAQATTPSNPGNSSGASGGWNVNVSTPVCIAKRSGQYSCTTSGYADANSGGSCSSYSIWQSVSTDADATSTATVTADLSMNVATSN